MSRLTNLSTIKIGFLKSWNSNWYDQYYYSNLLFNDLKIRDYLAGIFYKLRIVSDYIYIYRYINDTIALSTSLIFFDSFRYKSLRLKNMVGMNPSYYFFFKKKYWKRFLQCLRIIRFQTRRKYWYGKHPLRRTFTKRQMLDVRSSQLAYQRYSYFLTSLDLRFGDVTYLNFLSVPFYLKTRTHRRSHIYRLREPLRLSSNLINLLNKTLGISLVDLMDSDPSLDQKNWLFRYWVNRDFWYGSISMYQLLFKYILYLSVLTCTLPVLTLFSFTRMATCMLPFNFFHIHGPLANYSSLPKIFSFFSKKSMVMSLVASFKRNIELSIQRYTLQPVYFLFNLFIRRKPYILSAKMITDTFIYLLESGKKVVGSFYFINKWHSQTYRRRRIFEYDFLKKQKEYADSFHTGLLYLSHFSLKRSPIIGIRMECSGAFKKGRMSRVYHYNRCVKNNYLIGRMPNNTMIADIDYYQSYVSLSSSSMGIKTWIFLETYIYNERYRYISIVY